MQAKKEEYEKTLEIAAEVRRKELEEREVKLKLSNDQKQEAVKKAMEEKLYKIKLKLAESTIKREHALRK